MFVSPLFRCAHQQPVGGNIKELRYWQAVANSTATRESVVPTRIASPVSYGKE
jgi:hypothetical protein